MGSFFTNVQILLGKSDQALQKSKIIEKINQWTSEEYVTAEGEGEADRSIVIGSINENPWLAIYDEATEEQDLDKLDNLATQVSIATKSYAVGILVHDNDVLCLRLFRNGQLIDSYNSNPEMFIEDLTHAQKKKEMGTPELWVELIGDEKISALKKAWIDKTIFAEEILYKTAELTGWQLTACLGGYNVLDDLGIEKSTILKFRLKTKYKESSMEVTSGKPQFVKGSYGTNISSPRLGQEFFYTGSFLNMGGPSRGVDVAVWGPAITNGLVKINLVDIMKWDIAALKSKKQNQGPKHIEGILEESQTHTGEKSYVAHFDLFDISNGYLDNTKNDDAYDIEKTFYLQKNSEFHIRVVGNAIKEGRDIICMNCIPYENRDEGQYGYGAELITLPPPVWKPVNSINDISYYQYIEDLLVPNTLFTYINFKHNIQDRADLIVPILKKWTEEILVKEEGKLSVSYSLKTEIYKSKQYKLVPDKLFQGKRWSDNISAFSELYDMHVVVNYSESGIEIKMEDKLSFGYELFPHIILWLDIKNKNKNEIEKAKTLMESIVDELAETIMINQSFIASWRHVPDALFKYNSYLRACGVGSDTTKAWCERYLKAVSDTMWLSDELISPIDINDLKKIADVTPISHGLKFHLNPAHSLTDLENVLLPILATQQVNK